MAEHAQKLTCANTEGFAKTLCTNTLQLKPSQLVAGQPCSDAILAGVAKINSNPPATDKAEKLHLGCTVEASS